MDRPMFNLMSFPQTIGREVREALTFSPQVRGAKVVGRIVGPPGTEMYQPHGPARLKVPRAGRPGEHDVLNADDAVAAAKAGKMGLSLEGL